MFHQFLTKRIMLSTSRNYLQNDILKVGDTFYQATTNLARDAELEFGWGCTGDVVTLKVSGENASCW